MAAFPVAYAIVPTALYASLTAMLLALIFRVPLAGGTKTALGICRGSMVASFAQGIALGALVAGIALLDRVYAGGWWDWLTPFSLLTGVALLAGYALLGATWLVMKTSAALQQQAAHARAVHGAPVRVAGHPLHRTGAAPPRRLRRGAV